MYFALSKVSTMSMVNTLLIVMSFTFLAQLEYSWSHAPGTALWAFAAAGEMSQNSIQPRVQELRGQDGCLFDEDNFQPADERRTVEVPREFGAATARRQYHWDTRRPSMSIPPVR